MSIENPLPGGATRLKADRALWHFERGNCTYSADGKSVRFKDQAVERVMRSFNAARADREVHRTMASYQAIKGLPVTKPGDLMAPVTRRHFWSKKSVHASMRSRPHR